MKKNLFLLFSALFVLLIQVNEASAEEKEEITEENLNAFLETSGVPDYQELDYDEKLAFYESTLDGETLQYESTTEKFYYRDLNGELKEINDGIQTFATIPSSELKVSHNVYTSEVNGIKGKRVYLHYEWLKVHPGGTKGDKVGIAIPSGWNISAKSYECHEFRNSGPHIGGTPWEEYGDCNGGTYELNYYGAVWSLTQGYNVFYKGFTTLRMERTSSTAQNKVIGQYVQDTGKSTSWSVGWGPLSVSISGDKGSNKVSWDTAFTY